jgi:hypothetical protein
MAILFSVQASFRIQNVDFKRLFYERSIVDLDMAGHGIAKRAVEPGEKNVN